jgi:hypothetical protein
MSYCVTTKEIAMALTTAERQAAYRKRRSTAGDNGDRRLNTWLTTGASLALARLAERYGVTQREMIERLVLGAQKDILDTLDPGTQEWNTYMSVTV